MEDQAMETTYWYQCPVCGGSGQTVKPTISGANTFVTSPCTFCGRSGWVSSTEAPYHLTYSATSPTDAERILALEKRVEELEHQLSKLRRMVI
jgi:transcription elongation factor Elf1